MRVKDGGENMILGTGIDIIEIERVKDVFSTERRKSRVFTSGEIECFGENHARMAGFFSAKEALSKALGTGIRGIEFKEMEILKDSSGKPYFNMERLKPHLERIFHKESVIVVHVTISHDRERATAMVIIEEE